MATATLATGPTQPGAPYRWSRQEYEQMVEIGLFPPQTRLELLEGEILQMAAQTSYHATALSKAADALRPLFRNGYHLRTQMPLAVSDSSEPEPDIAVVEGAPDDYWEEHPRGAVLLVEVAYSSLQYDRERKLAVYARAGIPEYWIINLNEHQLEVYRAPEGNGYTQSLVLAIGDRVTPVTQPKQAIPVADLLPQPRHRKEG
jgi:Uma2 family endonuclease